MSATDNSNGRTLRADLVAANVYQRSIADWSLRIGSPNRVSNEYLGSAARLAFDAAAAFIAESRRRDPNTGELIHPTEGLPKEE